MPTTVTNVAVSATSDGDNTIVAAVAGHVISVLGYVLTQKGTGVFTFKSGSTGLSGAIEPTAGVPLVAPVTDDNKPWFSTAAGAALVITCGTGVDITGHLKYRIEKA